MPSKVVLVGLAGEDPVTAAEFSAYRAEGCSVWAMNDFYSTMPWLRPDLVFQMHMKVDSVDKPEGRWKNWRYEYLLRDCTAILMESDPQLDASKQITFPFRNFEPKHLSSTLDYMLAAIGAPDRMTDQITPHVSGIVSVEMRGFALRIGGEWSHQMPNALRWLGVLRDMGVVVTVRPEGTEERWRQDLELLGGTLVDWAAIENSGVWYGYLGGKDSLSVEESVGCFVTSETQFVKLGNFHDGGPTE